MAPLASTAPLTAVALAALAGWSVATAPVELLVAKVPMASPVELASGGVIVVMETRGKFVAMVPISPIQTLPEVVALPEMVTLPEMAASAALPEVVTR